ncbi:MAG: hypothetical protein ACLRFI_02975 [Alphaproteobacteria bacterium]
MAQVDAITLTEKHDLQNLDEIARCLDSGRINQETADYLKVMYSNGMDWFREEFHVLGKCFGAPKAAVVPYDSENASGIAIPMKISDINPLSAYLVQHRLDADPMRNQFFTSHEKHQIDLSVSSIVTVIVGAQKDIHRAINKITGKYYERYLNQIIDAVKIVLGKYKSDKDIECIVEHIINKFNEKYITSTSETVLEIVGYDNDKMVVELVRELDKIKKPFLYLNDVWRVKCLFDLIPQVRTFIERIKEMAPERVLEVRDRFYDIKNPRNYRDAKIIVNIGKDGNIVPMEIICQVRMFFEFECKTHAYYEQVRQNGNAQSDEIEKELADFMEDGVKKYNLMIVQCLDDLFDRVGWNILYSKNQDVSMFEGFPKKCPLYYPQNVLDTITIKLNSAVENEIFKMETVPAKLTKDQEYEIFLFMARFVLISAMPYLKSSWVVPSDTMAGKIFNFVMKEVQRYYK